MVKKQGDALVRLEDVANVVLGAENYDFNVAFSGQRSVFIGIKVAPKANLLDVTERVRAALPGDRSRSCREALPRRSPTTPPSSSSAPSTR